MGVNTFQVLRMKRDNVHKALSVMPGIRKLLLIIAAISVPDGLTVLQRAMLQDS